MIYKLLFFASILMISACSLFVLYTITRPGRQLKPFARNLLIGLVLFEVVLGLLHLLIFTEVYPPFGLWFFNLQFEQNLGAIFSALQLMMVGLIALVNMRGTPGLSLPARLYWLLLAGIFTFLSLDEFYTFHETIGGRVPTEAWRIPYALIGLGIAGFSVYVYFRYFRKDTLLFIMMAMGLVIMAVAGIGIEEFVMQGWVYPESTGNWLYMFEELFEMVGATIILISFISYLQKYQSPEQIGSGFRFFAVAALFWAVWMFFTITVVPALEARFLATPVNITYTGDQLALVGYQVSPREVKPGGEVAVTFYWRPDDWLPEPYSLSVHAVTANEGQSVTQSDDLHAGDIPADAWFPNVVQRHTVYLQIPQDLTAPAAYNLIVRVWYGPWPFNRPITDTSGLIPKEGGDRPLFSTDSLLLDHFVAAPVETPEPLPVARAERFDDDALTLTGVELPTEPFGGDLPVRFSWQIERPLAGRVTQFFHLVPVEDETQVYAFDRPPFGGLAGPEWPAPISAVDGWTVDLPDDFPAGTYNVYTGLYDPDTVVRRPVSAEGQRLPDDRILLGTLVYDPALRPITPETADLSAFCYAVADADLLHNTDNDYLVRANRLTGEVEGIGYTGTISVENSAFAADGRTLYVVDEREEIGLFGQLDLESGTFTAIGEGIAPVDRPGQNPVFGDNTLKDIDSLALNPMTEELWAADQASENMLFQINPRQGVIRQNTFGPGSDYLKIDLTNVSDEHAFVNVEDIAIDPQDGTFYIIASSEDFHSRLAKIDFATVNLERGTVQVVDLGVFTSAEDGQEMLDVEGMSFYNDGTLYVTTSNMSNHESNYDVLWAVNLETRQVTVAARMGEQLDYADFENAACLTGATAAP